MSTLKKVLSGQATVEFALVAPFFFAAFFVCVFGGSVAFFERSVALEAISSLGSSLPDGSEGGVQEWRAYLDASEEEVEELVLYLLLDDENNQSLFACLVDRDRVSVTSASITTSRYSYEEVVSGVVGVDDASAEAITALGIDSATASVEVVTVSANIEYTYTTLGQLLGSETTTSGVTRSYLVSQGYVYALGS